MAIKKPLDFINSLKDERVVYYAGERVKDVTQHPFMRICIDWMAMDYVLSNDPRYGNCWWKRTKTVRTSPSS